MTASIDQSAVTRAYDRVAAVYDLYQGPMEWLGLARRRRRLLSRAGGRVLEVGIGTGRNLGYYPLGTRLLGIDVSPRMLERARRGPLGRTRTYTWSEPTSSASPSPTGPSTRWWPPAFSAR